MIHVMVLLYMGYIAQRDVNTTWHFYDNDGSYLCDLTSELSVFSPLQGDPELFTCTNSSNSKKALYNTMGRRISGYFDTIIYDILNDDIIGVNSFGSGDSLEWGIIDRTGQFTLLASICVHDFVGDYESFSGYLSSLAYIDSIPYLRIFGPITNHTIRTCIYDLNGMQISTNDCSECNNVSLVMSDVAYMAFYDVGGTYRQYVLDVCGNVILGPFEGGSLSLQNNGYTIFSDAYGSGMQTIYDCNGNTVYTGIADSGSYRYRTYREDMMACIGANGLYGYINTLGEWVIQPQYENAGSFNSGLAAVELNGKWGYINSDNEVIIGIQYEYVNDYVGNCASVCTSTNSGWVAIDRQGNRIGTEYYRVIPSSYDLYLLHEVLDSQSNEDAWGVMNSLGDIIIPLSESDIMIL